MPQSWSAIKDALAIPAGIHVIPVFVTIDLGKDGEWTWHKAYDIEQQQGFQNK